MVSSTRSPKTKDEDSVVRISFTILMKRGKYLTLQLAPLDWKICLSTLEFLDTVSQTILGLTRKKT